MDRAHPLAKIAPTARERIALVRKLAEVTGFTLSQALTQLQAIGTMANNDNYIPADFFLSTPKGMIEFSAIYKLIGIEVK